MTAVDAAILIVGFLTAALSGVAGMGGGTILIAVLYAFGMSPAEAVPLFAAVQFVSNSSRTVAYVKHVEWHAAGWFMLAAVPATFLAVPYVARIDGDLICLLMAGLILASLAPGQADRALPARPSFVLAGLLNGALGPFVGATGLFVGRLFFRPEWRKETTIGTLALTQLLGHGLRVIALGFVGLSALANPWLLGALCACVIAGTALGKQLNARVSEAQFAQLFRGILVVLSLKLAYDGARGLWWN
ncbi:MAG TPA: sulfite exporter TauE/SafE family protein [Fontimonas sp.]